MVGRRPTISDVARLAGVSIATVSRVMRGKSTVSLKLADRVRDAAEELGYEPSSVARGLAMGTSRIVGVMVPQLGNPYFQRQVKAIASGAATHGYRMLVAESDDVPANEAQIALNLSSHADGIILCSPRMSDGELRELAGRQSKLVCTNRIPSGIGVVAAAVEAFSGMLELCGLLRRLGHVRVVALTGPGESWISAQRLRAIEAAAEFGIEPVTIRGGYSIEEGYRATDAALEHEPTAILAGNDLAAIGVLSRLRELSLRVPHHISLTGFDDIPFVSHTMPTITTVHSPLEELGRVAWELLHQILRNEPVPASPPMLKTRLMIRDSTGPPRSVRELPSPEP